MTNVSGGEVLKKKRESTGGVFEIEIKGEKILFGPWETDVFQKIVTDRAGISKDSRYYTGESHPDGSFDIYKNVKVVVGKCRAVRYKIPHSLIKYVIQELSEVKS